MECERKLETNQEIFAKMKEDTNYLKFFSYEFRNLKQGRKIAEGAQGEIFEAEFEKENGSKVRCVVKIFRSDFSLLDVVKQWPPGMLKSEGDSFNCRRFGFMGLYLGATRTCEVLGAAVLEDDRFAFIFNQEGGGLRRLIDLRMKQPSNQSGPFTVKFATNIMHEIALCMLHLHDNDILHRDLKGANVLVANVFGEFPSEVNNEPMEIKVADFECFTLVMRTNFWRAPQFYCDFQLALERALIERCWHSEPSERPEFKEIIEERELNCHFLTPSRWLAPHDKDPEGSCAQTSNWSIFTCFLKPHFEDYLLWKRHQKGSMFV